MVARKELICSVCIMLMNAITKHPAASISIVHPRNEDSEQVVPPNRSLAGGSLLCGLMLLRSVDMGVM